MPSTLLCAPKIPQSETQLPAYLPPTRLSLNSQATGRGRAPANRLIRATECYKDDISFAWGKTIPLVKHILSSFAVTTLHLKTAKILHHIELTANCILCCWPDEGKHPNLCNGTLNLFYLPHGLCVVVRCTEIKVNGENSRFILKEFYWYLVWSEAACLQSQCLW